MPPDAVLSVADKTGIASLVVATLAFVIAALALWVAAETLARGNRNASAATVLSLTESFRQAWDRYFLAAKTGDVSGKKTALADLVNLWELSCAMLHEKTLAGASEDIAQDYIHSTLCYFERSDLLDELLALQDKKSTFQYIRAFASKRASQHPKLLAGLAATAALHAPTKSNGRA